MGVHDRGGNLEKLNSIVRWSKRYDGSDNYRRLHRSQTNSKPSKELIRSIVQGDSMSNTAPERKNQGRPKQYDQLPTSPSCAPSLHRKTPSASTSKMTLQ